MIADVLPGKHFLSDHLRLWTVGLLLCLVTAIGHDRIGMVGPIVKVYREGTADVSGTPGIFPPRSRTNF